MADNSGSARSFKSVAIVDVLGHAAGSGIVEFGTSSRPLASAEREALRNGLAPRTVTFVGRDQAQPGVADESWQAVLVLATPVIEAATITVTSELWCGEPSGNCSEGGSATVAANPDGTWSVTKSNGGWVS